MCLFLAFRVDIGSLEAKGCGDQPRTGIIQIKIVNRIVTACHGQVSIQIVDSEAGRITRSCCRSSKCCRNQLNKEGIVVVPYKDDSGAKKQQVAKMFNRISGRYDFLNHFLSLGIDIVWRRRAIGLLKNSKPKQILDVATGTGDFAIEALKLRPEKVTGVDISEGMLEVGRRKIRSRHLEQVIELRLGDSENLPFDDNLFDAVIVAFGVRNFENLEKGLAEMLRVVKPGGHIVVLEFSRPSKFPMKQLYNVYFTTILPWIGRSISRDQEAYRYLPESVKAFPDGIGFLKILSDLGYKNPQCKPLTFGISSLYWGSK